MKMINPTTYEKGLWAEKFAKLYLRLKGYRFHQSRFKTAVGEIDLITETNDCIVFVEVKMRRSHQQAAYAVTPQQQKRLQNTALVYLQKYPTHKKVRFDVLLVNRHQFPIHLKNVLWSE